MKAVFEGDDRYFEIEDQREIINKAQNKIDKLTKEIVK